MLAVEHKAVVSIGNLSTNYHLIGALKANHDRVGRQPRVSQFLSTIQGKTSEKDASKNNVFVSHSSRRIKLQNNNKIQPKTNKPTNNKKVANCRG